MFKFSVIDKTTGQMKGQYRNLKEVSVALNLSYALTTRIYRKDFKCKKNHKSIQAILDAIDIVDLNPFPSASLQ